MKELSSDVCQEVRKSTLIKNQCCSITVDSATAASQMYACTQRCISQQTSHILVFFHNSSAIKYESMVIFMFYLFLKILFLKYSHIGIKSFKNFKSLQNCQQLRKGGVGNGTEAQFLVTDRQIQSTIAQGCRTGPWLHGLAGRQDNPLPLSTISSSLGLRIWPQDQVPILLSWEYTYVIEMSSMSNKKFFSCCPLLPSHY